MEDKKITEQESLTLITQMIEATKDHLDSEDGRLWLRSGVFTLVLGTLICALVGFTGQPYWNWLWLAFAVPVILNKRRRKEPSVKTYLDKAIGTMWQVFGGRVDFCAGFVVFDDNHGIGLA